LSTTTSIRIPRELKKKMDELRGEVNWSEEIRRFIESRVEECMQLRALRRLEKLVRTLPQMPAGTASRYVREDRDSH